MPPWDIQFKSWNSGANGKPACDNMMHWVEGVMCGKYNTECKRIGLQFGQSSPSDFSCETRLGG